ncbi:MAG: YfhO family protein [Acidobacteriota bacterium]
MRRVYIPYDLAVYHYSLADYGFQSVKHLRWPQWDSSMYSGMSFASNVQAALYYPGTWLMFLAGWNNQTLRYSALEIQTLAHVSLAFILCFYWLRGKSLEPMAYTLGAAVYAFSGYMCTQIQHFGLVVAVAWMPAALRGIDQAAEQKSWRPLWKLAAASALVFLGGYPPSWLVFAMVAGVYALAGPWRWKTAAGVVAALLFSLALCAVQLLPAWQANHFREPELQYGTGIKDIMYFVSYLVPNYFDFGLDVPVQTNFTKDYLYLGAPGILGIFLLFRRGGLRGSAQALAVLGMTLVMATNPFGLVWSVIQHSQLLADLCRSAYFLAGSAIAFAELAARGLDRFLKRPASKTPSWMAPAALVLMTAWALFELKRWPGAEFAHGLGSLYDAASMLLVFGFGLYVFRSQFGPWRAWVGLALLLSAGIDYKVFGTSKRFNAGQGPRPGYSATAYVAMSAEAFRELKSHPDARVLLQEFGPLALEVRHVGFSTPQGFDPFLSTQYRKVVTRLGTWQSNREFLIDPMNSEAMRLFGIRYVITAERAPKYSALVADPKFRSVGPDNEYYKVFEYLDANPPYGMEDGAAQTMKWEPEDRVFTVETASAGRFTLTEQFYPGWSATVDGTPSTIEKWESSFQAIHVPAGKHTIEFHYREQLLPAGAAISLLSLGALYLWFRRRLPAN